MCEALSVHYSELPRCILSSTKLKVEISKQNTKFYNKNLENPSLSAMPVGIRDCRSLSASRTSSASSIVRQSSLRESQTQKKNKTNIKGLRAKVKGQRSNGDGGFASLDDVRRRLRNGEEQE